MGNCYGKTASKYVIKEPQSQLPDNQRHALCKQLQDKRINKTQHAKLLEIARTLSMEYPLILYIIMLNNHLDAFEEEANDKLGAYYQHNINGTTHKEITNKLQSIVTKHLSTNCKHDGCIISIIGIISIPTPKSELVTSIDAQKSKNKPQNYFDKKEQRRNISDISKDINYRMAEHIPLFLYYGNAVTFETELKAQRPSEYDEVHPKVIPLKHEKFVRVEYEFKSIDKDNQFMNVTADDKDAKLSLADLSEVQLEHIKDTIEQGQTENKTIKIVVTDTRWNNGSVTSKITYPWVKLEE